MALTQPQRVQISGEILDLPLKVASAQSASAQIDLIKQDLLIQDGSVKIFFDKFNLQAESYEEEHKFLDGTTYSKVSEQDIIDSAKKIPGNKFFPGGYINTKPFLHPSAKGLPTTITTGHELELYYDRYLQLTLDFLINGQTSAVIDDTTTADYVTGTLEVTAGGQTVGNLLLIKDLTNIALVRVISVTGLTITVEEIIPPTGPLLTGASVIENLPAFSAAEKNTLVSLSQQELLTELTDLIKLLVDDWEVILNNQLTNLDNNTDNGVVQASQNLIAIASLEAVLININAFQALPDTGGLSADSKFDDSITSILFNDITSRISYIPVRVLEIVASLGVLTQMPDGTYVGAGVYFNRIIQTDSRINLAGGPLTEFYEKDAAIAALQAIVDTSLQKQATFLEELDVQAFSTNPTGANLITVENASDFAALDTVFVVADTLAELTGTITTINGNLITVSFNIPNTYTTSLRARIYKQL